MPNTLKDKLNEIKTEKDTKIISENIKRGVSILGVEGSVKPLELNIYCQGPDGDGTWSEDEIAIPYQFSSGSAVSIGTDVYLLGSQNSTTAYKYDTLTATYTQLTDIPYEFYQGSAVVVNTDVYLIGGYESSAICKYDVLTDTYTQLTDMPGQLRK